MDVKLGEKITIIDSELRKRIDNVIDILEKEYCRIKSNSVEGKSISEDLNSLKGLLNSNELTESQIILFKSIEESVKNKYMKKKNGDKTLFGNTSKNNIVINGDYKVQKNQNTINNIIDKQNIINNNTAINSIKNNTVKESTKNKNISNSNKKIFINDALRNRIKNVIEILHKKLDGKNNSFEGKKSIIENLCSLQFLFNEKELTESQLVSFESIEKSANNKDISNNNKNKTLFNNDKEKNIINRENKKDTINNIVGEKIIIVDEKLMKRINNVINILSNKLYYINDDSAKIQDTAEKLGSLYGLLEYNTLTEAQSMLFESIEKSVNNENTKNIKNTIKTPSSKNEVKNNINTINEERYNKIHNKKEINNKNTTDSNKTDSNKNGILINKTSTIDNNIIINNKKIHYRSITKGKKFTYDDKNKIINKNFKILSDNFTNVLRNSAQKCSYFNFGQNDYINDIVIAVEETKDNWQETILPCSEEQENDIKILQTMYNEFATLFNHVLADKSSYGKIFAHGVINTTYNNDLLTSEMYYYILRKLNKDMFYSRDFTSNMIKNVIEKIKEYTIKTPETYELILQWLLYCSINRIISLFPKEIIDSSSNDGVMQFISSCILCRDHAFINKLSRDKLSDYNKYVKVTSLILDYIIQLWSKDAIIESFETRVKTIFKNLTVELGLSNEISKIFQSIKNSNELQQENIQEIIRNNKKIKDALSYIPKEYRNVLDIKYTIRHQLRKILLLISSCSYNILCNEYNFNLKNKIHEYVISKKNLIDYHDNFTNIPEKFRTAFNNLLKNDKIIKDDPQLSLILKNYNISYNSGFYGQLINDFINDWKEIITKNDFRNMIMFGIEQNNQEHQYFSNKTINCKSVENYILFLANTIKTESLENMQYVPWIQNDKKALKEIDKIIQDNKKG